MSSHLALKTFISMGATLTRVFVEGEASLVNSSTQVLQTDKLLNTSQEENLDRFTQLEEADDSLWRAVALFIGVLVTFSMIVCLCATYWCLCWALQCPSLLSIRAFSRAAESCSRFTPRRSRRNKKRRKNDLPPAYEAIATSDREFYPEIEEDPPTYLEAICNADCNPNGEA